MTYTALLQRVETASRQGCADRFLLHRSTPQTEFLYAGFFSSNSFVQVPQVRESVNDTTRLNVLLLKRQNIYLREGDRTIN